MRRRSSADSGDGQSHQSDPEEQAIDEFMGANPRARHLEELCSALRIRIRALNEDLARTPESDRESLAQKIREARQQLAVLKQELAITQFVEDGVRATLRDQRQHAADEEDEEY